jgi:hypothetical protein
MGLHILKDDGMLNEACPKAIRSVIQVDGHFTFIRLFTTTRVAAAGIAIAGAMAANHFGGFVFMAATVVAQTQHTDRDFWWVCREEEREQNRKWWWDLGPFSLARAKAELPYIKR